MSQAVDRDHTIRNSVGVEAYLISQPIQYALQNISGGELVDIFGAFFTAHICVQHTACDGHGGQPFVPEENWEITDFHEVVGEIFDGLDAGARTAVHINGQADDKGDGFILVINVEKLRRIRCEFLPAYGFERRRDETRPVRNCEAERLGSRIKAQ